MLTRTRPVRFGRLAWRWAPEKQSRSPGSIRTVSTRSPLEIAAKFGKQRVAPRRRAQPFEVPLRARVRRRANEEIRPDHHGGPRLDRKHRTPQVHLGHQVRAPGVPVRRQIAAPAPGVCGAARLEAQDEPVGEGRGRVETERFDHRPKRRPRLRVVQEGTAERHRPRAELLGLESVLGERRKSGGERRLGHRPRPAGEREHRGKPPEHQQLAAEQPLPVERRPAVGETARRSVRLVPHEPSRCRPSAPARRTSAEPGTAAPSGPAPPLPRRRGPGPRDDARRYVTASSPRLSARSRALGLTDGRNGTSQTRARSGLPDSLAYSSGSHTVSSVPTADLATGT